MIAMASQHDFAVALLAPGAGAPAGLMAGRGPMDARHRFAVHRNNFVVSLIDALAEAFPVTLALVGTDFFRAMARERVFAEPPRSPVLVDYADGFPDFIARFAPAAAVPYLADVARIEALCIRAYHAADASPVPEATYRALAAAPGQLASSRVELHPACHWLSSRHAAYSIWQAHQGLVDISDAELGGIDVDLPQDVLITRPAFEVGVSPLAGGAIVFLDALRRGQPLGKAFAAAHASCESVDDDALFALLIGHGLLAGIHSTDN